MKIFIDGGTRSAVNRMFPIWKKMGHTINSKPRGADIQLSSIRIKSKNNIPIVLRLDGVYYDKATNFRIRNKEISKSHHIADAVIYQSELSKKMCEKYLLKRKTKIYSVIHNGIDSIKWLNPKKHGEINIVSCAKWRRPKRLQEIIKIFMKYLKYYPKAKLHIIGPMVKGSRIIKRRNIIYHGNVGYKKMIRIYSEMDIYLHLCKKDSCPSTVIESIASGIPVITTNICGGATEMCKLTDGCVIVNGESESLEPDYIYQDPYNKLPTLVGNRILKSVIKLTKEKRRVILPEELNIEHVAKQYLNIMEKLI